MKKNSIVILAIVLFVALVGLLLLKENLPKTNNKKESDYNEQVLSAFKGDYKKEAVIESVEKDGGATVLTLHLKEDPQVVFKASYYWAAETVPVKRFFMEFDYEDVVNKKFLEDYFKEYDYLEFNYKIDGIYSVSKLQIHNNSELILKDISKLDNIAEILYNLHKEKDFFGDRIKVIYFNKYVTIGVGSKGAYSLSEVQKELEKLKQ